MHHPKEMPYKVERLNIYEMVLIRKKRPNLNTETDSMYLKGHCHPIWQLL